MEKQCAACGTAGSGRFCSDCGAPLDGPQTCRGCSNELPAGARFCNMCGLSVAAIPATETPTSVTASPATSVSLPWLVAGGAVAVALAAVLILPRTGPPEAPSTPAAAPAAGATGAQAVDLDSMSPREAADRLFNRVMSSVSAGDSTAARSFVPMAIAAYEMAEPLDLDGRFHVATLHMVSGDIEAAGSEAEAILDADPTHLFGLITAAQVAIAVGEDERARGLYDLFLENYDREIASGKIEYSEHATILPTMRAEAVAAVEE